MRRVSMADWNATDSGSLYKIFDAIRTWEDAEYTCKNYGAQLAHIDSDYKNAYVREMLNDHIQRNGSEANEETELWIGLKNRAEVSTDASHYSNFYENEKADGCAAVDKQGKWRIHPCLDRHAFVCQQVNVR